MPKNTPVFYDADVVIELLQAKKQALLRLLEVLVAFEHDQACELRIIGSVAECGYWLDSDLDAYLDKARFEQAWEAWLRLDSAHEKLDAIFYPLPMFKAQIERTGLRPQAVIDRLRAWHDEKKLIAEFAQRRQEKILRSLDSAWVFVEKLAFLKTLADFEQSRLTHEDDADLAASLAQDLCYARYIEKVAFRFVWVGLMILSRYEFLLQPKATEVMFKFSEKDWHEWVEVLANPTTQRPPFIMPASDLVADFYRCQETRRQGLMTSHSALNPTHRITAWQQAFEALDTYTREWIAQNWRPLRFD